MKPVKKILKFFLIWRILLFIPVVLAVYFFPLGNSFPYSNVSYYKHLPEFFNNPIISTWSNFDGVHYLNIAASGYTTEARFFPLFPLLIFLFSFGNISFVLTYFIALILPNVFLVLALAIFYKLMKLDYSGKIVFDGIFYLLIFPTAFFLASVYSESLFLFLLFCAFYFARKEKWGLAILTGALLMLTKFIGVFIIPALIFEYLIQNHPQRIREYLIPTALVFIMPLGLVFYSFFNLQKWGNALYFLTAHTELGNSRSATSLVFPPQTLFRYCKILTSLPVTQYEWWVAVLEVFSFVFGCVFLYIAWKKQIRISYLVFGGLAFLLPVLSGTFSSLPRYLLVSFPIFIGLAHVKSKFVKLLYTTVSLILSLIILMFFSRGYFVS